MTVSDIFDGLLGLMATVAVVIVGIAVLVIFWGVFKYVRDAGSEEGKKEGKFVMVWGIVVLFIMVSLWSLIALLQSPLSENMNAPGLDAVFDVGTSS